MLRKPPRWNVSPALIAPNARRLWNGLAFIAPLWGHAGKGALLNSLGQPLAGANLTAGSTLQWRGTPYGLGFGRTGTGNVRMLYQDNFAPIVTSDGAGTGDFTFGIFANPIAEAVISEGLSQTVNNGNPRADLVFNANASLGAASGSFTFIAGAASSTVAIANVIDGRMHGFFARRRGTEISVWVDGVLRASTSLAILDVYTAGTSDFAIGTRGGDTAFPVNAATDIIAAYGWNRALSAAEMRMLARDPFCMFRPQAEWRGVWTPVTGGTSGTGALSLRPMSVSGVGKMLFKGTGAVSLTSLVTSGVAKEIFTGTGAANLSPLTVSGAGKERFTASGTISLTPLTSSTSGKEILTATGALTLTSLNVSGTGSHIVAGTTSGSGAISLSPLSVAGVGKVILKGTGTISLTPAGMSATGKELFTATGAVSLAPLTASGAGKEAFTGSGAISLTPFIASGIGKEILSGTASILLSPLNVVGSNVVPTSLYVVEIVILADAREIVILDYPREIVIN